MWREYTREKTGRPGLTVGVIAFAFAGTLGLAQLLTQQRNVPLAVFTDESLDDWPIQFSLPAGYQQHSVESIPPDEPDGWPSGVAVYRRSAGRAKPVRFEYRWLPPGTSNKRALSFLFEDPPEIVGEMQFGDAPGLYFSIGTRLINPIFVGVVCRPNGLTVSVTYSPGRHPGEEYEFERICESISVKDGYDG